MVPFGSLLLRARAFQLNVPRIADVAHLSIPDSRDWAAFIAAELLHVVEEGCRAWKLAGFRLNQFRFPQYLELSTSHNLNLFCCILNPSPP